ncbi:hypothetical protein FRB98_002192 [Tulasnella sp. 332]|nr:hypothetical protein FRB98_002192 [Tulasnella sp. 332]
MAALESLYRLPLWLLLSISIIVGVNAQEPQSPAEQLSPGIQNLLPRPLIHFKLGSQGEIITSTRNRKSKQWQKVYTSDSSTTDSGADPAAPVVGVNGTTLPAYDTIWLRYSFDQLIDHSNNKSGTFQQRYYFSYEFYEPGGPIFFNVPSESSLDNYDGSVTNSSLNGYLAQMNRGAAVVLEHRFFGLSNPYPDLTEDSLAFLTVDQAISDILYFAQTVKLPMPGGNKTTPTDLPWVLVGGRQEYAAMTQKSLLTFPSVPQNRVIPRHPGIFAAAWASSAVLQAQDYFWSYFDVISQFMPRNCSADIKAVVSHLDDVFTTGTAADIIAAKASFALSSVINADDVMAAIREPLFTWQDLQPYYQDTNAGFYAFCNYLEYDRTKKAYETSGIGVGLATALPAYGNWTAYEIRVAGCTGREESCYGTHIANESLTWTNTTIDNPHRSWAWLYCNQLGWYFSGAPQGWSTITSRLTTPDSEARLCSLYFPEKFPMGVTASETHNQTAFNVEWGGWSINTTNVFFANGKKDPWRAITVSSDLNPQVSTDSRPIAVADGGFHCSDLVMQAGQADPTVGAVQTLGSAYIYQWLAEWYMTHNVTRPANATSFPVPSTLPTPTISYQAIPTNVAYGMWQENVVISTVTVATPTSISAASDAAAPTAPSGGSQVSTPARSSASSSFRVVPFRWLQLQTHAFPWLLSVGLVLVS